MIYSVFMLIAYCVLVLWPCVCGSICMCVCLHAHTVCMGMYVYICVYAHRDDFVLENVEHQSKAQTLLDQTISMLQSIAQQNANVVDRMKLMNISRNMVGELCNICPRIIFRFNPGSLKCFNRTVSVFR